MSKDPTDAILYLVVAFFLVLVLFYIMDQAYPELQEGYPIPSIEGDGELPTEELEPAEPDYEAEYLNSAYPINQEHNFGLFETKLLRVGYYTWADSSGNEDTAFRADIWVKNAGQNMENFTTELAYVRKLPNTYNITSDSFDGAYIEPGEERSGYILFSTIPPGLSGNVSLSIGDSKSFSTIFSYVVYSPHLYEIELL